MIDHGDLTQWFSQSLLIKAVPRLRAGFMLAPVNLMAPKWPTVTAMPMASGALNFESTEKTHTHTHANTHTHKINNRIACVSSNQTWFVGVAHTKNGENENESKEELNTKSLHWQKVFC